MTMQMNGGLHLRHQSRISKDLLSLKNERSLTFTLRGHRFRFGVRLNYHIRKCGISIVVPLSYNHEVLGKVTIGHSKSTLSHAWGMTKMGSTNGIPLYDHSGL